MTNLPKSNCPTTEIWNEYLLRSCYNLVILRCLCLLFLKMTLLLAFSKDVFQRCLLDSTVENRSYPISAPGLNLTTPLSRLSFIPRISLSDFCFLPFVLTLNFSTVSDHMLFLKCNQVKCILYMIKK